MFDLKYKIPIVLRLYVFLFFLLGVLLSSIVIYFDVIFVSLDLSFLDYVVPTLSNNVTELIERGYSDRVPVVRSVYLVQMICGFIFVIFCMYKRTALFKSIDETLISHYFKLDSEYNGSYFLSGVISTAYYFSICIVAPIYLNLIKFDAGARSRFANIAHISDVSLLVHVGFIFLLFSGFLSLFVFYRIIKLKRN